MTHHLEQKKILKEIRKYLTVEMGIPQKEKKLTGSLFNILMSYAAVLSAVINGFIFSVIN